MKRRDVLHILTNSFIAYGIAPHLQSCKTQKQQYNGYITGAPHQRGHRLRDGTLPIPTSTEKTSIVIIGAGISGLSAARRLYKEGVKDIILLEVDTRTGGNSLGGNNAYAQYPYGAHYLPIPDIENTDLLDFLEEHGIITHYENGIPAYKETDMCYAPHERLFYKGKWHEGIANTVAKAAPESYRQFMELMARYADMKNSAGQYLFRLPIETSYTEEVCQQLDGHSFRDFLSSHSIDAPEVLWYADYCCRDDYGMGIEKVSAFAGIHYFTSRRPKALNCSEGTVLTWQEGNAHLVELLELGLQDIVRNNALAYHVDIQADSVHVRVLDCVTNTASEIVADYCIISAPQFVTQRLLQNLQPQRTQWMNKYHYAPWVVVTLSLKASSLNILGELHWDNVVYGSEGLGYISANNQTLQSLNERTVITWYKPLDNESPADARRNALNLTAQDLAESMLRELENIHPEIVHNIEQVDAHIWGHGMIAPVVGFYSLNNLVELQHSIDKRIFFAHSDLSGISLFEEAFYHGNRAAREIIAVAHKHHAASAVCD
ncbi:MAG: FAD-dependent oxidoreductase [Candidatus Kapabacteria bacterium]|nr:FAD-dependent oxidoreductase [Candidatus Kapabacteria bacterium]